ncbi:uncharacterized protein FIBRA_05016 [Fibroporia radiculosa]|uniref:Protein kinase domain-containing protein n=1 Tax=Fibroporia radiculosa TaxID=599839 RepID=J4HWV1_9APHY|nr:uncharacterized protein FIBRA_05016 [Fibroporia radiculosa]CCM02902.1 predicted protein [Fibroporia radiculosa]
MATELEELELSKLPSRLSGWATSPEDFKSDPDESSRPESSHILPNVPSDKDEFYPSGAWRAWSTGFLGAWLIQFCISGYMSAFGVMQSYYSRGFLDNEPASSISWIGGLQLFLDLALGALGGHLVDRGYFRHVVIAGSTLFNLSAFHVQPHHYYQVFLTQGLGMGAGIGLIFLPTSAIVSKHFKTYRAFAMVGLVASGGSLGGFAFSIALNNLLESSLGFGWSIRVTAFITTALVLLGNLLISEPKPQSPSAGLLEDVQESGDALRQIPMCSASFWDKNYLFLLAVGAFTGLGIWFPSYYVQSYALQHNVNTRLAFYAVALMNLASGIGRILPNWLGDRWGVLDVYAPCLFCAGAIEFAMLGCSTSYGLVLFALLATDFSSEHVPLSLYLPVVASLSKDGGDVGKRLGIALFPLGIGSLIGTPINGALVGNNYAWWKGVTFASTTHALSGKQRGSAAIRILTDRGGSSPRSVSSSSSSTTMNTFVTAAVGVTQLAGNLSGVPYLGAAASVVGAIQNYCQQVATHKRGCKLLANKVAQILPLLEGQPILESPGLREAADEMELYAMAPVVLIQSSSFNRVLSAIHDRVRKWSQYGRLAAWINDQQISDGLSKSIYDLETIMTKFNMRAQIHLNNAQVQFKQLIEYHQEEWRSARLQDVQERKEVTSQILRNQQDVHMVAELYKSGQPAAQRLMEAGQQQLLADSSDQNEMGDQERDLCRQGLVELHQLTGIPPSIKRLDGEVVQVGFMPVAKGGHSHVWKGLWLGKKPVALKVLQGVAVSERAENRFKNEIKIWDKLHHVNVQPLYGILLNLGPYIYTVSPWQDNGNILDFMKVNPTADRLRLLLGAAKGVAYLHDELIVHGNVRCANILVTAEREACICDFGMSKLIGDVTETPASATLTSAGSTRWIAPELIFDADLASPTLGCDIWSYGMTMLECFTMRPPWGDVKREAHVITIMEKRSKHPTRPEGHTMPTDDVWAVMVACWGWEPHDRMAMGEVASRLQLCVNRVG